MHLFFYNIFLLFYKLIIRLVSLWNRKARLWIEGRKGLLEKMRAEAGSQKPETGSTDGNLQPAPPLGDGGRDTVWMHCASLGEFEQGRPVLEAVRFRYPNAKIVLTFFSPSGYEIRKNYSGADHIYYLPLDNKIVAGKFLDIIQPSLVLWVKYEYWYYYLVELKKRKIPLLLVSGIFRKNQPFFKWYGRLHQYMLDSFTHMFVQTEASKELLGTIRFTKNISVTGDTRFDRVVAIAEQFEPIPVIEWFIGNSPVIVAGSTWSVDEEELDHYANTHPGIKFIIAPHEIEEERLKEVEKLFHNTVRYSRLQDSGYLLQGPATSNLQRATCNTLIIDNIGMLSKLYKYASITYVGGGFGDDGVHNVLEAAVYGKPVVFGPVYDKYIEAVELLESGGALTVENALEVESVFDVLLANEKKYAACCEAAKTYVYSHKGATEKIVNYIQENRLLTN